MTFSTCDLCDDYEDKFCDGRLQVLPPIYRHFGKRHRFSGMATTLKVFEDNALVRSTLEAPGNGRVLVIDGGGSLRSALVGGNLGKLAQRHGWSGMIVHGCVRDTLELNDCEVGIRALGTMPRRSARKGGGEKDLAVMVSGVLIQPGDMIYADDDGLLVARDRLA